MQLSSSGSLVSPVRLAYGLIPLLTVLENRQVDTDQILAQADIPRFALVDPRYTMTFEQELLAYRAALAFLPEPHASLEIGQRVDLNTFSVLGLAMQSCANLREMSQTLLSYPQLAWGASDYEIYQNDDHSIYRMISPTNPDRCEQLLIERDLASMLNLYRNATGIMITHLEIRFAYPKPASIAPYEAFFQCPVSFDAQFTETVSDNHQDEILLSTASSLAKEFYIAQCEELSEALDQPFEYATTVKKRLKRTIPMPDLEALANQMAMAPRTLQRRLKEEAVTFSDLVRDVRLEKACHFLSSGGDTLQQIAWKLGFNDQVAFSHAFKRWTGQSPGQWREAYLNTAIHSTSTAAPMANPSAPKALRAGK